MNINKLLFSLPILFLPLVATASTSLSVPYTSQAPFGDWSQPWQDTCEETSILMTDYFYASKNISKETARDEILRILRIKENTYGFSLDENATKVASMINNFFPWEAYLVYNPTLDEIKSQIDSGHPVIVPYYGKALYNPYFSRSGPEYHMNVIVGYDDETQKFIVHETGMNTGSNFKYAYNTILDAIHDFVPGKTQTGAKVAVFTRQQILTSGNTDGDNDGLTKIDELRYGTILWLQDSDGDGVTDGKEVDMGRSPTCDCTEITVENGRLVKSPNDPKVYLIENNLKRHILNGTIFLLHGWQWWQVQIVSEDVLNKFEVGMTVGN